MEKAERAAVPDGAVRLKKLYLGAAAEVVEKAKRGRAQRPDALPSGIFWLALGPTGLWTLALPPALQKAA